MNCLLPDFSPNPTFNKCHDIPHKFPYINKVKLVKNFDKNVIMLINVKIIFPCIKKL